MDLYNILKIRFGSDSAIGRAFPRRGKPRSPQAVGKWKIRGVPEDVAILSHLDESIPYEHPSMPPAALKSTEE
ncbi:hypothetical protein IV04_14530 [Serratia sp. Ag1]|nr:hypothetical protein [Serratia sp. Ag1]KFK98108.1 hypothetical protein IV04_14530 [Serratia sp. Ag1]